MREEAVLKSPKICQERKRCPMKPWCADSTWWFGTVMKLNIGKHHKQNTFLTFWPTSFQFEDVKKVILLPYDILQAKQVNWHLDGRSQGSVFAAVQNRWSRQQIAFVTCWKSDSGTWIPKWYWRNCSENVAKENSSRQLCGKVWIKRKIRTTETFRQLNFRKIENWIMRNYS